MLVLLASAPSGEQDLLLCAWFFNTFEHFCVSRALFILQKTLVLRKSKTGDTVFAWVLRGEVEKRMQMTWSTHKTHANGPECSQLLRHAAAASRQLLPDIR